jgi:hypothetical protein
VTTDLARHQVRISTTSYVNQREFHAEEGAKVSITDDKGNSFPLEETSPGTYHTIRFAGVVGNSYQLSVTRANGKRYTSDPVLMRSTPAIDDVYGVYQSDRPVKDRGIQIYVNSKDPLEKARYFRWEYVETYVIKSPFPSFYEWLGGNDWTTRTVPVGVCFSTDSSSNVLIKSSTGFSDGKVFAFPLRFIDADSYMLRSKYSILVRQYSLNEQSYNYWRMIRDVNETQGTIFDRQPGTVVGNIRADDPEESVLGYFDASAVYEKRVFLTPQQFEAAGYRPPGYQSSCREKEIIYAAPAQLGSYMAQYPDYLIWDAVGGVFELLPKACCACTDVGSNVVPSFWE